VTDDANQIETLTRINLQDFMDAWGLGQVRRGRRLLEWLFTRPARRFAHEVAAYDAEVGQHGLQAGANLAARRFIRRLQIRGRANIPSSGPVLVLANHPGLADAISIFAALPRADLRIIAAERPFLNALPHTSRRLIYVPDQAEGRMAVVREATKHLKQGGAILTFPAGRIEPDPAVMPGAVESLQSWSESIALFARLAPQTRIVPAIISGVISAASLRLPVIRVRRDQKDRERLAAMLQILLQPVLPAYKPACVRVDFYAPLLAADLIKRGDSATVIRAVTDRARRLIEQVESNRPPGIKI